MVFSSHSSNRLSGNKFDEMHDAVHKACGGGVVEVEVQMFN